MTSTSINVGIEERNSCRVLKPPGGAHSDIFGVEEKHESVTSSKITKVIQKTTISECLAYGTPPAQTHKIIKASTTENNEIINANDNPSKNANDNPSKNENTNSTVAPTNNGSNAVPQRVRVPPGGFSSGLW